MKLDHDIFFGLYRDAFGSFKQSQVDGINQLLGFMEADSTWNTAKADEVTRLRLAYVWATTYHETAATMRPIDEYGTLTYFEKRYGYKTKVGKELGNKFPGDGALFHGRGDVQITGRGNYENVGSKLKINLVGNPDLAKVPEIAYKIMVGGMLGGWFTGKGFKHYIIKSRVNPKTLSHFVSARRIINGVDQAQRIAQIAVKFDDILIKSLVA